MDNVVIKYLEKPKLKDSVLIEGLPGVGNVGKLAAEHLVEELEFVTESPEVKLRESVEKLARSNPERSQQLLKGWVN